MNDRASVGGGYKHHTHCRAALSHRQCPKWSTLNNASQKKGEVP
jgi:hypothetical protein